MSQEMLREFESVTREWGVEIDHVHLYAVLASFTSEFLFYFLLIFTNNMPFRPLSPYRNIAPMMGSNSM